MARKRIYKSNADRQRAYRKRVKKFIEDLKRMAGLVPKKGKK